MTLARKDQVCLEATPYYHLINRCVRRAFLCGLDSLTGTDYSHRKQWILDRLQYLLDSFAIHVCAYAVMSNHCHLVVWIDVESPKHWTQEEVLARYGRIHSTQRIRSLLEGSADLSESQRQEINKTIEDWRERLFSISWFEKCLNEYIARKANKEDKVTGRFWQGRFKSQPLLDDAALVTCMAYVDLNPIRAGLAETLEDSDFTAVQQRLQQYIEGQKTKNDPSEGFYCRSPEKPEKQGKKKRRRHKSHNRNAKSSSNNNPLVLVPMLDQFMTKELPHTLPISQQDYFLLVDATGRLLQEGRHGHINDKVPPVLCNLGINPKQWIQSIQQFERRFPSALGAIEAIEAYVDKLKQRCWCVGKRHCGEVFG